MNIVGGSPRPLPTSVPSGRGILDSAKGLLSAPSYGPQAPAAQGNPLGGVGSFFGGLVDKLKGWMPASGSLTPPGTASQQPGWFDGLWGSLKGKFSGLGGQTPGSAPAQGGFLASTWAKITGFFHKAPAATPPAPPVSSVSGVPLAPPPPPPPPPAPVPPPPPPPPPLATPGFSPVSSPVSQPVQGQDATVQAVLAGVNAERAKAGLPPLALSRELSAVATARSQDMANRNYFAHTDPDGHDPFWHLQQAGIAFQTAGENIAEGQPTPESVVSDWMNSPGHRANILNPAYRTIGIGVVASSHGLVWTQDFAG